MAKEIVNRDTFNDVMVPNYNPQPVIPTKGLGSRIWDQSGKDYVDFASGIAVNSLGHCHPKLISVLNEQAKKLWHVSNAYTNEPALRLAKKLIELTFADRVYFCNSGAEANEAAFKLARKYAKDNFSEDKSQIISFLKSFHGRTLFSVAVGGQPKYSKDFSPLPANIDHAVYNDINSVKKLISNDTCAVVMETIQGEGGVIPASDNFLKQVRALCDQYNALLIFDEVQTGVSRTGSLYSYMDIGVIPDVLTTAKGIGGGFPIGAMLTSEKCAEAFSFGAHGSTFGGNPLACSVALEVLSIVSQDLFLAEVKKKSEYLIGKLSKINDQYGVLEEVRGKGLMLGGVLKKEWKGNAAKFVAKARENGVVVLVAGADVIRIVPALNITTEEIDDGVARLEKAVQQIVEEGI